MKRSSTPRRAWWLLLLVLLAACTPAAGLLFSYSSRGVPSADNARNHEKSASSSEIVCFGQVDLLHGVTALFPLQPGRVVAVLVEEGQIVDRGTVLVRLEDGAARSRVAEARAALDETELRLKQTRKLPKEQLDRIDQQQDAVEAMKNRLAAARHQHSRQSKWVKDKLADANDLAVSEDRVKELEAMLRGEEKRLDELKRRDIADDIRRAEKEVEVMKARLDQARFALEECVLKAPTRGSVLRLLVGPGDVLGSQAKQPAVQFAGEGPLVVRADAEQASINRDLVGETVQVEDESHSDLKWSGKVRRVANWITQRRSVLNEPFQLNDVPTVEVLITLDSDKPALRIGQRVRVHIGG
ncbi:MAG: HlyD family secretion protein [Gemmataceae bacterium]